MSLITALS